MEWKVDKWTYTTRIEYGSFYFWLPQYAGLLLFMQVGPAGSAKKFTGSQGRVDLLKQSAILKEKPYHFLQGRAIELLQLQKRML